MDGPGRRRPKEDENYWLEGEGRGQTRMEENCWTDQDPPRVVESTEEEEELGMLYNSWNVCSVIFHFVSLYSLLY